VPRNVEIKARVRDLVALRSAALAFGAHPEWVREQTDRYYELDGSRRLKLRSWPGGAELIRYQRVEDAAVRPSDYEITPVRDEAAGVCLVPKGEPLVVVRKRRELLLADNVRIHLDEVDGLGTFLELEAVLDEAHDEADGYAAVDRIMRALGIDAGDLVRASYAELLRERRA
jgi:adenylate cyclase class IV